MRSTSKYDPAAAPANAAVAARDVLCRDDGGCHACHPRMSHVAPAHTITHRPAAVMGLVVMGRPVFIASTRLRVAGRADEPGLRLLPGRNTPVTGRAAEEVGRCCDVVVVVPGRAKEVPGRGTEAMALSSRRMSAIP